MQNMPSSSRNLKDYFSQLLVPRVARAKRHELLGILMIAVCAMLCSAENFTDMETFGRCTLDWFTTWLALPHGIRAMQRAAGWNHDYLRSRLGC